MGWLKPGPVLLRTGFKWLKLLGTILGFLLLNLPHLVQLSDPYKLVLLPLFDCYVPLLTHLRQLDKVLLNWKWTIFLGFNISFDIILFYRIMFLG